MIIYKREPQKLRRQSNQRVINIHVDVHTRLKELSLESGWPISKIVEFLVNEAKIENKNAKPKKGRK